MANAQELLQDALSAFARGEVENAKMILTNASESTAARNDLLDTFDVCCVRASIAAMEGESSAKISNLMSLAAGSADHAAVTQYLEGVSTLSTGRNLTTAKLKFEAALVHDPTFMLAYLGLGAVEYQQKQYKASFAHYRTVLENLGSASPPIVRIGLGLCSYRMQHLSHAQKCFERALSVNPDDELAMFALVTVYLDMRMIPRASEMVHRLQTLLPGNTQVLLRVANLMYFKAVSGRRMKTSSRSIEQILRAIMQGGTESEAANAHFQLGRLRLASGDYEEAKNHLLQSIEVLPDLLAARIHYARLLMLSGKGDEATTLLVNINEKNPNHKEVLQLLAADAARRGKHEAALEYANVLVDGIAQWDVVSWVLAAWCARLDNTTAAKYMRRVAILHKTLGDTPSWELLSNIAALTGDTAALQEIVDSQLGGDFVSAGKPLPVHCVPLVFNLGLLLEKDQRSRALELYLFLVKQHPSFRLSYFRLFHLAKDGGNYRQAVMWMTLLLEVFPDDELASSYIGQIFFEQKRQGTAMLVMQAQKKRSIPLALAQGATFLWYSQQHGRRSSVYLSDAKERFIYVLKRDRGNVLAAHGLACCLGLESDYTHCQSMLDRVGELLPNDPYVQTNYRAHVANLKTLSDSFKQAIDCLEAEPSKSAWQLSALAFCYACTGQYKDAIHIMRGVVEQSPADPMMVYNLSLLCCASFVSSVSSASALSESEGKALAASLEEGLNYGQQFLMDKTSTSTIATAKVFLKTVCAYAMTRYDRDLSALIQRGASDSAAKEQLTQRWAETYEEYQQRQQAIEEQRLQEEKRRDEEKLEVGRQILQDYENRSASSRLTVLDPAQEQQFLDLQSAHNGGGGGSGSDGDGESGSFPDVVKPPKSEEYMSRTHGNLPRINTSDHIGLTGIDETGSVSASILAGMQLQPDLQDGDEDDDFLTLNIGNEPSEVPPAPSAGPEGSESKTTDAE